MFDTTINRLTYPNTTEVHEHKAPTDESIKLLNEFQEKALANIIQHIRVETNILKGDVLLYKDPLCHSEKLITKFNLNGGEFTVSEDIDRKDFILSQEVAIRKLADAISRQITEFILTSCSGNQVVRTLLK